MGFTAINLARKRLRYLSQFKGYKARFLYLYDCLFWSRLNRAPLPLKNSLQSVTLKSSDKSFLVRIGTSDFAVLQEIFIEEEYGSVTAKRLNGVKTILDLGANVGYSMRLWLQAFPNAKIVGVEPDRNNYDVCRKNLAKDGECHRASVLNSCVAANVREVSLDTKNGAWAIRMSAPRSANEQTVTTTTIERLLGEHFQNAEVGLLKCDIEGAEAEVFRDCNDWLARFRNILIELHSPYRLENLLSDLAPNHSQFEVVPLRGDNTSDHRLILLIRR